MPVNTGDCARAKIETYTINHTKQGAQVIWVGRDEAGYRIAGNADLDDEATRLLFESGAPFGADVVVTRMSDGRNLARFMS